jgi:invasion protein IalB
MNSGALLPVIVLSALLLGGTAAQSGVPPDTGGRRGTSPVPMPLFGTASPHTVNRSGATCERWRRMAARLGETYAGHQLRAAVSARLCAFADDKPDEDIWGWPWRHRDVRADLPPLRHGQYGAWEIRCAEAGPRRRCALALETTIAASLEPESPLARVVAHVVIDTIAGRESVLWRVHVAREVVPAEKEAGVSWQVAGLEASVPFDACGRRGCLAEADPRRSAEVASWLWGGRPLPIALGRRSDGSDLVGLLPAHGFRVGLTELIRLRRQEGRSQGGR